MPLSFLNQWFNNDVMKAMAWTFAHSIWQGLVAALLAAVIISATRRTTAKLRYNLLGTVLILFLATAFITFFIQWQKQIAASGLKAGIIVPDGYIINSNVKADAAEGFIGNFTTWFNDNTSLIIITWVLFFSLKGLKLFTGLSSVNRMRNYRTHPVTEEWKIRFEHLRNSLGIRQHIDLLQSELVKVPVAIGYLKPVILLPIGLLANIPAEQVETILLHELGHIRRKDYLVNFIQRFAEAIFFFNPGMLWLSSLLRQEREACCDDIAVASSNQKRNYLDALVAFQEYSLNPAPYTMAIRSKRHYLLNRVKRIITNENKKLNLFEKSALLFGVILFSAFTYSNQKKETGTIHIAAPVQQMTSQPPSTSYIEEKILTASLPIPVKREKKRMALSRKPVTDTIPAPKDTVTKTVTPEKKLPPQKDWENITPNADKTLQEIIRIKEQIGEKKEIIGKKKEQLEKQEGKNKEEILKEIEKERGLIEGKRGELEKKRALYVNLKRQEQNNKERKEKQEEKPEQKSADNDKTAKVIELKLTDAKELKQVYQLKLNPEKKIAFLRKTKPNFLYNDKKTKVIGSKLNDTKLFKQSLRRKSDPEKKLTPLKKAIEPKPLEKPPAPRMKTLPVSRVIV